MKLTNRLPLSFMNSLRTKLSQKSIVNERFSRVQISCFHKSLLANVDSRRYFTNKRIEDNLVDKNILDTHTVSDSKDDNDKLTSGVNFDFNKQSNDEKLKHYDLVNSNKVSEVSNKLRNIPDDNSQMKPDDKGTRIAKDEISSKETEIQEKKSSTTSKSVNSLGSSGYNYTFEFNKVYSDIERNMLTRINASNRRRIIIILLSTMIGLITLYVFFGRHIKKKISDETADIAKGTLENETLKIQTQELAMAVVQTILNDKEITSHAATFLQQASSVKETQIALLQLLLHVLQHPDSLKELTIFAKKLILILSEDKVSLSI